MFNWFKKTLAEVKKPLPIDPIQQGVQVNYLGVEWTVTTRVFIASDCCFFTLSRITKNDQLETVSPAYFTELVTLKK